MNVYIIGLFLMNIIIWARYAFLMEEEDEYDKYLKYQSCIGSLISPLWPVSIPGILINYVIKYKKEEKKKELQQCICPECEKKFLQE